MTVKTAVGYVNGTRAQPSLMVSVFDDGGSTLAYDTALAAAINAAPPTILNAAINIADVTVIDRSASAIQFELNYGRKTTVTLTRAITEATKPKKEFNWIAPIGVYDSGGEVTSSYDYIKNRLNRFSSMNEFVSSKPTLVDPLGETLTLSYTALPGAITDAYVKTVTEMAQMGVFNNAPFWGYSLGELQMVSFTGTEQSDGAWSLTYGLGQKLFRVSVGVAEGITIPELRGCDGYWPIEEEFFEDGTVQTRTKAVVVGQLWELDDFSQLNLPWQGAITTRTNDTSGIITTLYTHDVTGSDVVTVYWEGGYRLSANVSGVTATTITFSAGSGDILPAAGTRVLVIAT